MAMTDDDVGSEARQDALRVLIIDHHDSYTLNLLISIVEASASKTSILVLAHDHALLATVDAFRHHLLPHFDAIILGPGPGHPSNDEDFGPARRILSAVLERQMEIPILGVCLGHQGIAVACGGRVVQGDSLRHGLVSSVCLTQQSDGNSVYPDLFDSIRTDSTKKELKVIRYNSLTVDEHSLPPELLVTAWSIEASCLAPPPVNNDYFPFDHRNAASFPRSSFSSTQRVIMGLQHIELPLWGVQFHPESISSQGGVALMSQFLYICKAFWIRKPSMRASDAFIRQACERMQARKQSTSLPTWIQKLGTPLVACAPLKIRQNQVKAKQFKVVMRSIHSANMYDCAGTVYKRLFQAKVAATSVWLDSVRQGDPQSRFSYMSQPSWHISYDVEEKMVKLHIAKEGKDLIIASFDIKATLVDSADSESKYGLSTPIASRPNSPHIESSRYPNGFWSWLSELQSALQDHLVQGESQADVTFKTGFVGYMNYEMKVESLRRGKSVSRSALLSQRERKQVSTIPSAWFGFCDKLLAYDHHKNEWVAIALVRLDDGNLEGKVATQVQKALNKEHLHIGLSIREVDFWMSDLEAVLTESFSCKEMESRSELLELPPLSPCDSPTVYKEKVEAARAYIAQGESYEICLTNQFKGKRSRGETSKQDGDYNLLLYQKLRRKNPAPYSAFLNLGHGTSILSTSPERFMNIEEDGKVEMRPIKGTQARAGYRVGEEKLRKSEDNGDREAIAFCQIEDEKRRRDLECDPKERAENLMIVDLIRADLLSFCSPESVKVPLLMKVESYETVHQLVTTIRGKKDASTTSVQALQRCFPPGSMTGAPKVRSVEILEKLEGRPRGVYSGILGWIGIDGAASTSVVIRTVVIDGRDMSIGAGGAITYLSDAEKEWQEVLDKLSSIAIPFDYK